MDKQEAEILELVAQLEEANNSATSKAEKLLELMKQLEEARNHVGGWLTCPDSIRSPTLTGEPRGVLASWPKADSPDVALRSLFRRRCAAGSCRRRNRWSQS